MNLLKHPLNINFWKFFPLIIFVFNPKIDVISIPGYWQGIRLDDIIILFYLLYYFFCNKFNVFPNLINKNIVGYSGGPCWLRSNYPCNVNAVLYY